MGLYEDQLLPRCVDFALGSGQCEKWRARAVEGLTGTVLEVGFGSGRNLPHLPKDVSTLLAVDPAEVGQKLARERIGAAHCDVQAIGLDGQSLPVASDSVDAVLSTWTLCTLPDLALALGEIARVLKPGGRLHFLEHGLSPDPGVARWQRRLNPLQRRVAGGCNLDRDIPSHLRGAGFHIEMLQRFELKKTPRIAGAMVHGRARPHRAK